MLHVLFSWLVFPWVLGIFKSKRRKQKAFQSQILCKCYNLCNKKEKKKKSSNGINVFVGRFPRVSSISILKTRAKSAFQ